MMPAGSAGGGRNGTDWLPLGSATLIDWKQIGRSASARGAMAFASRIGGEPVLVRTWTNESTTYFEFCFLAYEELSGTVVVSTARPEDTRLRLTATVDVEGRIGYSDVSEFAQHPRTGLYGSIVRTVEVTAGELATERITSPTAAEAEIFEYAPESALLTSCGAWITQLLDCVRAQLIDGEIPDGAVAAKPAAPPPRKAPAKKPSKKRVKRETLEGPPPEDRAPKSEPPRAAQRASVGKLFATTNSGDSWEVTSEETFLGRSKQCQIVLKSQRVSRKHASITKEDDGFYINDLGAANGIWAGTEKIDREKVADGAEYIIGDVLVSFSLA